MHPDEFGARGLGRQPASYGAFCYTEEEYGEGRGERHGIELALLMR